jgi:peptide-methionine (S)-S-oxide reductase
MLFSKSYWAIKLPAALLLGVTFSLWQPLLKAAESPTIIAAPTQDSPKTSSALQTTVVAGGCFWGIQGVFEHVKGVHKVVSGYAGGDKTSANYKAVSTGTTGHAEAVQITFDPAQVSYGELLHIFFSVAHDPTQLNRQGPDSGMQYRSEIFYTDNTQKNIAQTYITQLNQSKAFQRDIVTRVESLKTFYAAEIYHQDFLIYNPNHPYIVINDLPKIDNLKRVFPNNYSLKPVMVSRTRLRS